MQTAADDPEQLIETAVAAHRAGRLDEAGQLYVTILRANPRHPRAAFNLGVLNLGRRAFDQAEALFAIAYAADPANLQAWDNRVNAMIGAGRFEAAEATIAAAPAQLGERARAAEVRLREHWAANLQARADLAAAEAQLRRACAVAPDDPDTHDHLGRFLIMGRRLDEALAAFAQALQAKPDHAAALVNQGAALQMLGRPAEAEAAYRQALTLEPSEVGAATNLRALLTAQGRGAEAQAVADAAQAQGALFGDGHIARGTVLHVGGRHEAALAAFRQGLADGVDRSKALAWIGAALGALGRYDEALAALDEATALRPDEPLAPYQRGFLRLVTGDFAGGWPDYELRWRGDTATAYAASPWLREHLLTSPTPADLAGRHVRVLQEQGVGDQIMFASVIPEVVRDAAHVELTCDERLAGLFAHSFPQVEVRGAPAPDGLDGADVVVGLGSLGHAYRNRRDDFPATPYLRPRAEVAQRWTERLGPRRGRLRVGLSWRGGTTRTRMSKRSIALKRLAPLLDLRDCEFVSLQYGDATAELAAANDSRANPIRSFPAAEIDNFEALAGLVLNLDLVVSVQTTLVHLSGALGAPCLAMLPRVPEWRYGASGETMAWYGSVRLLRQGTDEGWDDVIVRARGLVADWPPADPATRTGDQFAAAPGA